MFKNILQTTCLILGCCFGIEATAIAENRLDPEENIYQKIADVSLEIEGEQVQLSTLYRQQPLIIAQIFTRCSGICTPYIIQLKESLRQINSEKPYKVLVFSFDPRDQGQDMLHLSERYQLQNDTNWIFATTDQIEVLTNSIGFTSDWDETRQEFEHEALLTGINKMGIIKKKVIGMNNIRGLTALIHENNNGFEPSYPLPGKNSFLSCFDYDPETGKTKPGVGLLLILVPGVLTFGTIIFLGSKKPLP